MAEYRYSHCIIYILQNSISGLLRNGLRRRCLGFSRDYGALNPLIEQSFHCVHTEYQTRHDANSEARHMRVYSKLIGITILISRQTWRMEVEFGWVDVRIRIKNPQPASCTSHALQKTGYGRSSLGSPT